MTDKNVLHGTENIPELTLTGDKLNVTTVLTDSDGNVFQTVDTGGFIKLAVHDQTSVEVLKDILNALNKIEFHLAQVSDVNLANQEFN